MPSAVDLPKTHPLTVRLDARLRGLLDACSFMTGRTMSDLAREAVLARARAVLGFPRTEEEKRDGST